MRSCNRRTPERYNQYDGTNNGGRRSRNSLEPEEYVNLQDNPHIRYMDGDDVSENANYKTNEKVYICPKMFEEDKMFYDGDEDDEDDENCILCNHDYLNEESDLKKILDYYQNNSLNTLPKTGYTIICKLYDSEIRDPIIRQKKAEAYRNNEDFIDETDIPHLTYNMVSKHFLLHCVNPQEEIARDVKNIKYMQDTLLQNKLLLKTDTGFIPDTTSMKTWIELSKHKVNLINHLSSTNNIQNQKKNKKKINDL